MMNSAKEEVVRLTKETGVLPCIKLPGVEDCLPYARAMYEGGARVVEVTMTTPGVLNAVESIVREIAGLHVGVGTVLSAAAAEEAIRRGASLIVNPAVIPEVIQIANRYGVAVYSGAFTATECLLAMQAGATMVKIFPAGVGGPRYMANLKMVFPGVDLIPSGGVDLKNAGEFIVNGACAVSGARTFMDFDMIRKHGMGWLTQQVASFIDAVRKAKQTRSSP